MGDRARLGPVLERRVVARLDGLSASLRELGALQVRVTREADELSRARHRLAGQAFLGAVVGASVLVLVAFVADGRRRPIPVRRWTH